MCRFFDAVHGRVAHVHVGVRHIDFSAEKIPAFFKFTRAHATEEIQIFFDGTVAPGAWLARFREGAAVGAHVIALELTYISFAELNQFFGKFIRLFVIVTRIVFAVFPVKT